MNMSIEVKWCLNRIHGKEKGSSAYYDLQKPFVMEKAQKATISYELCTMEFIWLAYTLLVAYKQSLLTCKYRACAWVGKYCEFEGRTTRHPCGHWRYELLSGTTECWMVNVCVRCG
eukprot:1017781_1